MAILKLKNKFYEHKSSTSIYDVNIDKIEVSRKFPFGIKCFKNFTIGVLCLISQTGVLQVKKWYYICYFS